MESTHTAKTAPNYFPAYYSDFWRLPMSSELHDARERYLAWDRLQPFRFKSVCGSDGQPAEPLIIWNPIVQILKSPISLCHQTALGMVLRPWVEMLLEMKLDWCDSFHFLIMTRNGLHYTEPEVTDSRNTVCDCTVSHEMYQVQRLPVRVRYDVLQK